jgi:regulator of telomere elongation helicase 1
MYLLFAEVQIIYASRTHTQLNQAVKELKNTAYATKVKSVVLSSRAQLCTHETTRQLKDYDDMSNSCKRLVANFEAFEKNPKGTKFKPEEICGLKSNADACRLEGIKQIVDIEDLLQIGKKYKCCPYYVSRSLRSDADIIFVPYNYVLNPAIRSSSLIEVKVSFIFYFIIMRYTGARLS